MRVAWRLSLLLALALFGLLPASVAAAEPVKTRLVLTVPRSTVLGRTVPVVARLQTTTGAPVPGARIVFLVDGRNREPAWTRPDGTASARRRGLTAGKHTVTALFDARRGLLPSRASAEFLVVMPELVVATLPATPGMHFSLGRREFVSDRSGVARLPLPEISLQSRPKVQETIRPAPGVEARFSRWYRKPPNLTAALDYYRRVRLTFVDRAGKPIDGSRIESVTVRSSIGARFTIRRTDPAASTAGVSAPFWVQSSRVVPLSDGLIVKDLYYVVDSVIIDGTNVVNRAQQRFVPTEQQHWEVRLLFYTARITVRDVLFPMPIGTSVRLVYPSGRTDHSKLGPDGQVTLPSLPRGEYKVTVEGPVLPIARPVVMSKDQEFRLEAVSYLDIAFGATVLATIALGLFFRGRPHLLLWFHPRRSPARVLLSGVPARAPHVPPHGAIVGRLPRPGVRGRIVTAARMLLLAPLVVVVPVTWIALVVWRRRLRDPRLS